MFRLHEYAKEGPLKKLITLAVANLAGVPSIVFGLFGLAFFVTVCGLGVSAIAGILTLAVLTLPIVINTVRETLSQIPNSWRESSLALGASKTQTVLRTVLPAALPGILPAPSWDWPEQPEKRAPPCLQQPSSRRLICRILRSPPSCHCHTISTC